MHTENDTNSALAGWSGELSLLQGPDKEVDMPLDRQTLCICQALSDAQYSCGRSSASTSHLDRRWQPTYTQLSQLLYTFLYRVHP